MLQVKCKQKHICTYSQQLPGKSGNTDKEQVVNTLYAMVKREPRKTM